LSTNAQLNIFKKKVDIEALTTEQKLEFADEAFDDQNYYGCIPYYESLYNENPEDAHVLSQTAIAYFKVLDYKNAEKYYQQLVILRDRKYPLAIFDLALSQKFTGNYDASIKNFTKFSKTYRGEDSKQHKKNSKRHIDGCNFGKQAIVDSMKMEIINIGDPINKAYYELAPMLIGKNTLIFSSLPSDTIIHVKNKKEEKKFVTRIYESKRKNDA